MTAACFNLIGACLFYCTSDVAPIAFWLQQWRPSPAPSILFFVFCLSGGGMLDWSDEALQVHTWVVASATCTSVKKPNPNNKKQKNKQGKTQTTQETNSLKQNSNKTPA
jgi:hypothetical protein